MKKIAIILLVAALISAMSLSAVAEEEKPFAGTELTVYNWFDYIDPEVLDIFEAQTGISVTYVNFTQNEDMYAKLEAGAGAYDVIFPSEYMIERLIKEDRLEELNLDNIPNLANVIENLRNPSYDPGNAHSVPYMWGTLGILYNTDLVSEPITSWQSLFDGEYAGSIFMMNSLRDTIGLGLKALGYSMNTRDPQELREAGDLLVKQKQDHLVSGNFVDETKDKMVAGEAALAVIYSGDALYAMEKADNLAYVVPEEGSNIWVDGMCIPKGTEHKEAAECFINFMCDPEIARMNMEYIYYSSPIKQVVEGLDEEEAANEALNPPEDVVARCEFYNDISDSMDLYENIWMEIRMAR